jgi:hypothetical protein
VAYRHHGLVSETDVVTLVYGSSVSIEESRREVESRNQVSLTLHDSSYRGGDYYRGVGPGGEEWIVQANTDGEEPAEDEWSGPTVLYVDGTQRDGEVASALDGSDLFTHLRSNAWTRTD